MKEAFDQGKKVRFTTGKLFIDGAQRWQCSLR